VYERNGDLAPFQPLGVFTRTHKLAETGVSLGALHVANSKIKPSGVLVNVLFFRKRWWLPPFILILAVT
jgi:hypothetical protein